MARAVATASYWQPALLDTTLVDRAILVASELVTNAVVHAPHRPAAAAGAARRLAAHRSAGRQPRLLRLVTARD
jgi:hypothetical protein